MAAIKIAPQSPRTKFVAIDVSNKSNIISEVISVKYVVKKADKTGIDYSLMYVPKAGQVCIF